jgi:hypothetical protein
MNRRFDMRNRNTSRVDLCARVGGYRAGLSDKNEPIRMVHTFRARTRIKSIEDLLLQHRGIIFLFLFQRTQLAGLG